MPLTLLSGEGISRKAPQLLSRPTPEAILRPEYRQSAVMTVIGSSAVDSVRSNLFRFLQRTGWLLETVVVRLSEPNGVVFDSCLWATMHKDKKAEKITFHLFRHLDEQASDIMNVRAVTRIASSRPPVPYSDGS